MLNSGKCIQAAQTVSTALVLSSGLVVGSSMVLGAPKHFNAMECETMTSQRFLDDFAYMATTTERCTARTATGACPEALVKWHVPIRISVIENGTWSNGDGPVRKSAEQFSKLIENATQLETSIEEEWGNAIIFVSDPATLNVVRTTEIFYPPEVFERFSNSDLRCFGRVYINDKDEIFHTNIGIKPGLTEQEIESCVYEELFNSSGLLADPHGDISLFDGYPLNFESSEKQPFPAELLLMLKLYYKVDYSTLSDKSSVKNSILALCSDAD